MESRWILNSEGTSLKCPDCGHRPVMASGIRLGTQMESMHFCSKCGVHLLSILEIDEKKETIEVLSCRKCWSPLRKNGVGEFVHVTEFKPRCDGDPVKGVNIRVVEQTVDVKTRSILLTAKQFEILKKSSENMHKQDPLATHLPIYCVAQWKMMPAHEGCGDQSFYLPDSEGHTYTAEELIKMFRDKEEFMDTYEIEEEKYNEILENIETWDAEEIVTFLEATEIYQTRERVMVDGQYYLSRAAAQAHIDANSYHYSSGHVYVNSCWRNPEFEVIMDVVHDIANPGGAHR